MISDRKETEEIMDYKFKSDRLGFRQWRDEDLPVFAEMNGDPIVMEYFPKTLTSQESDSMVKRIQDHFEKNGYGLYAVDHLATESFIGFIGFAQANFNSHFTPCTEIGWRIHRKFWNQGLATEGAARCLQFGFQDIGLREIFSWTATINEKSERIMKKINMRFVEHFDHPKLEYDDPLLQHVLYKIDREEFNNALADK